MDSEEEIHKMADKLAKDQEVSKLKALSILQSRYQSEKRLEEAAMVERIIATEESKSEKGDSGFYEEF